MAAAAAPRGSLWTQPRHLMHGQRVVCEEAHTIRRQLKQAAKACFSRRLGGLLLARQVRCCAHTPSAVAQNHLDDLYALVRTIPGFSVKGFFSECLLDALYCKAYSCEQPHSAGDD